MRRGTISISMELKRKLDMLKGERTWNEFLEELLNTSIEAKISRVESFLRETADKRDVSFEKLRLRLRDDLEGDFD
ncbi:MAG: antitoxin VapB family protein [Candidatus Methanodesulfokora sp.]|jgi:predicted CopG family antitoxin